MEGGLTYACVECNETITEPICPPCLARSMQIMVAEDDPELAATIREDASAEVGIRCLFCQQLMNRCAHCFSKEVYLLVQDQNPELAEEFLGRFDFGLRRTFAEERL